MSMDYVGVHKGLHKNFYLKSYFSKKNTPQQHLASFSEVLPTMLVLIIQLTKLKQMQITCLLKDTTY